MVPFPAAVVGTQSCIHARHVHVGCCFLYPSPLFSRTQANMPSHSLETVPNELLRLIALLGLRGKDLAALARTSRTLREQVGDLGRGLQGAARQGNRMALRLFLTMPRGPMNYGNPYHLAHAAGGHNWLVSRLLMSDTDDAGVLSIGGPGQVVPPILTVQDFNSSCLVLANGVSMTSLSVGYNDDLETIDIRGDVTHLCVLSCPKLRTIRVAEGAAVTTVDLPSCNLLTDVSALGRAHTLDLRGTRLTDVSALGRVHTLNLRYTGVTDVSALGRVHTLNLSGCWNLTDVSALGGVRRLDLSWCTLLTDVSALGSVYELNLGHCTRLTDVSALGGVHTLSIFGCKQLTDLSALGGVPSLIPP